MKHNIIMHGKGRSIIKSYSDSLRLYEWFIKKFDPYYFRDIGIDQIDINYFEESVVDLDLMNFKAVIFAVDDLATVLSLCYISKKLISEEFTVCLLDHKNDYISICDYKDLLDRMIRPLSIDIMKRHLEIFNVKS